MAGDIHRALRDYLAGLDDLQAYVGFGDDARVYQDYARQEQQTPYVVIFEEIGTVGDLLVGTPNLARSSMSVMAAADTRDLANDVFEVCRENLTAYSGKLMLGVWIDEIFPEAFRATGVDVARDDSQRHHYWTQNTFTIHHEVKGVKT